MKQYKPTTSSQRQLTLIDRSFLWKGTSIKHLVLKCIKHTGGRNNTGRITVFQRGGGSYHRYRLLDFKRNLHNIPGELRTLEFDPNRSAFIALIYYSNGVYSYILAPNDSFSSVQQHKSIMSGISSEVTFYLSSGNCTYLNILPIGSIVHNIEQHPKLGGTLCRAAGTSAQLLKKYKNNMSLIKLPSGTRKLVSSYCKATVGSVSNSELKFTNLGKAGRSRWLGIRPHVRAYAMNPVDHPMGGRTHGGKQLVTPWGLITKGKSTRKKKKINIVE